MLEFNADLRALLSPYIGYGLITGHSFRAGLATLMAQSGYDDNVSHNNVYLYIMDWCLSRHPVKR